MENVPFKQTKLTSESFLRILLRRNYCNRIMPVLQSDVSCKRCFFLLSNLARMVRWPASSRTPAINRGNALLRLIEPVTSFQLNQILLASYNLALWFSRRDINVFHSSRFSSRSSSLHGEQDKYETGLKNYRSPVSVAKFN